MKVILLTDVKGRGTEGDVIEVARGFAANYLLPRKMAIEATPGNLKQLDARVHNIRKREEARRGEAQHLAGAIAGKKVVIEAKAGDTGKLFGSITGGMVAEAIGAQLGVDVERKKLDLHGHIKTLGDHEVDIHLHQDVTTQLVVTVVAEGSAPAVHAEPGVDAVLAAVEEAEAAERAEELTAEPEELPAEEPEDVLDEADVIEEA